MQGFESRDNLAKELFTVEIANLQLYGYGIKAFMLSMIETALQIGGPTLPIEVIAKIMDIGRWQLETRHTAR